MPQANLPPLVNALLDPSSYPHHTGPIELRQTHISYVFLAGDYVYKVKKPVYFGFLNYSTLSRRRYYCGREVKLNRLLCADTYLGVVPIKETDGRFVVNGKTGRTVEYAVWMRRLPEDRMMHNLLERGEVTAKMIAAVAEKLVPFHRSSETSSAIARYGDWAIRYNVAENIEQWQPYIGRTISAEQDAILRAYIAAFHARKAPLMQRRVEEQRIRRCHSDLRSDAVCFDCDDAVRPECVCIFDCVEFNRRITHVDIARDVSFLAMDLRYRGQEDLAEDFVRRYKGLSDDPELAEVFPYYACYNACVRGKVEGFLLDLPEVGDAEKRGAARRARRYFDLAVDYASSLRPAFLITTCGLSASGKSTVAADLAGALGATVISSDIVRKQLAGLEPEERVADEYRAGLYAADMTERTYAAMNEAARPLLLEGQSVVLDASFLRRAHRKAAMRLAKETGAQFACVLVEAKESAIRRRFEKRLQSGTGPSDARWEIYLEQKRRFQRPAEMPPERLMPIDATRSYERALSKALSQLRALSPLSVPR